MKQGAYLVIETTEALNVIDVNSGIRAKTDNQEENAFEVNKIAAEEIARQLRLRDMGGIVIVDSSTWIPVSTATNCTSTCNHSWKVTEPSTTCCLSPSSV